MADSTIGSLPAASALNDSSLLVVEQLGAAMKLTGLLLKQYVQNAVQPQVDAAGASADAAASSATEATEAAAEAKEAAAHIGKVPTKFSQLTDDVGYLKKTEASATYIQQIITDTQSCEVSTAQGKFYLMTARGGKLYIGGGPETVFVNGLMTPTEDTSAATKKYVDDKVSAKNPYTLIEEITVSEDTTRIERNAEPNGTAYAFTDVYYEIQTVKGSGTGTILVSCNGNLTCGQHACIVTSAGRFASGFIKIEHGFLTTEFVGASGKKDNVTNRSSLALMVLSKEAEKITKLIFHVSGVPTLIPMPAGTKIRIYGVRI